MRNTQISDAIIRSHFHSRLCKGFFRSGNSFKIICRNSHLKFRIIRHKFLVDRKLPTLTDLNKPAGILLFNNFYLFLNAETGLVSLVYKRNDGDVGMIEGEF